MNFDQFTEITEFFWNKLFFTSIPSSPENIFYPTHLILTQTKNHFLLELAGLSKQPRKLKISRRRCKSINEYFCPFHDVVEDNKPACFFDGHNSSWTSLLLANGSLPDDLFKRFPICKLYDSKLVRTNGRGRVFNFGDDATEFFFSDCILVGKFDEITRAKYLKFALVIKRKTSKSKYKNHLLEICNIKKKSKILNPIGFTFAQIEDLDHKIFTEFQSLFLSSGIHETTIGDFINNHPQIITKGLNTTNFVYEPLLEWRQHDGTVEDKAINPDLMIKRDDGFYDIVDLKLALTLKKKITKGERKRRRFIDYVEEGISQLANYREYFNYTENAKFAESRYGISVNDPRLYLIVGNHENVSYEEVRQACRKYGDSPISIIDYDVLAAQLLRK